MNGLVGRIAIVTGGRSGIGQGVVVALACEGAKVVVCGRRPASLDGTLAASRRHRRPGHLVAHPAGEYQDWPVGLDSDDGESLGMRGKTSARIAPASTWKVFWSKIGIKVQTKAGCERRTSIWEVYGCNTVLTDSTASSVADAVVGDFKSR